MDGLSGGTWFEYRKKADQGILAPLPESGRIAGLNRSQARASIMSGPLKKKPVVKGAQPLTVRLASYASVDLTCSSRYFTPESGFGKCATNWRPDSRGGPAQSRDIG